MVLLDGCSWLVSSEMEQMAEINTPGASTLGHLDLRHPEFHTVPRTMDYGWLLTPLPGSRGSLTNTQPVAFPSSDWDSISASVKKEETDQMPVLAPHCSSPLSPPSFGPSTDAPLPFETHVRVHACTEILGTSLTLPHEHGHGCVSKLVLCPRSKIMAAGGHHRDRTRR